MVLTNSFWFLSIKNLKNNLSQFANSIKCWHVALPVNKINQYRTFESTVIKKKFYISERINLKKKSMNKSFEKLKIIFKNLFHSE